MKQQKVPRELQGILWSRNIADYDLSRDKNEIIHGVLSGGTLGDMRWLFRMYPHTVIREVFLTAPQHRYTKSGLNFVSTILFNQKTPRYAKRYLKMDGQRPR